MVKWINSLEALASDAGILFNSKIMISQLRISPRNLIKNSLPVNLKESVTAYGEWKPFPKVSPEWRNLLSNELIEKITKRGEESLLKEFRSPTASQTLAYSLNGAREPYENISFGNRKILWDLLLAEIVEHKERFLNKIADGIWSISEETFWGSIAHINHQKHRGNMPDVEEPIVDLFAAETACLFAWTDYFVGEALGKISPLLRDRIYFEVKRRILRPMETVKYSWMGDANRTKKLHNWVTWIMSNYITTALILESDSVKRFEAVKRAVELTDAFLDDLGDEGSCEEGPMYFFGAGGCVFDILQVLESATDGKVKLYHESLIKKMAAYIYKVHVSGVYFINISDADTVIKPDSLLIYRMGKEVGDRILKDFGAWLFSLNCKST